jgi:hypothetical protein
MSPRKRKLLKFGLLVGLPFLLVLGFWPYPEPPELPVRSYFIGFTNMFPGSKRGVEAQFFLINYPANQRELPVAREFSCLENGVWKPWLPALTSQSPMMVTHDATIHPNVISHDTTIHPNVIFNLTVPHTNGPWRAVLEFPAERLQPNTLLHRAWEWLTSSAPPPGTFMSTPTGLVAVVEPKPAPRHRSLFFTNDTTGGPVAPPPLEVGEVRGFGKPVHYGLRPK